MRGDDNNINPEQHDDQNEEKKKKSPLHDIREEEKHHQHHQHHQHHRVVDDQGWLATGVPPPSPNVFQEHQQHSLSDREREESMIKEIQERLNQGSVEDLFNHHRVSWRSRVAGTISPQSSLLNYTLNDSWQLGDTAIAADGAGSSSEGDSSSSSRLRRRRGRESTSTTSIITAIANVIRAYVDEHLDWFMNWVFYIGIYVQALALCYYQRTDIDPGMYAFYNTASLLCWLILVVEILYNATKTTSLRRHFQESKVDLIICLSSVPFELAGSPQILAICRSFRSIRIVTKSKTLYKLALSIMGSVETVLWLFVLLLTIFYIFVVIGMEMFSFRVLGVRPYQKEESFDTFWSSMLALFQITSTNNWNDVMFTVLPDARRLWYCLYFIIFYFLVCMVVLNVLTTLIIQNFTNDQEMVEQEIWTVKTKDGLFQIRRVEPWSHQTVRNAQQGLRDKEHLDNAKKLLEAELEEGEEDESAELEVPLPKLANYLSEQGQRNNNNNNNNNDNDHRHQKQQQQEQQQQEYSGYQVDTFVPPPVSEIKRRKPKKGKEAKEHRLEIVVSESSEPASPSSGGGFMDTKHLEVGIASAKAANNTKSAVNKED